MSLHATQASSWKLLAQYFYYYEWKYTITVQNQVHKLQGTEKDTLCEFHGARQGKVRVLNTRNEAKKVKGIESNYV